MLTTRNHTSGLQDLARYVDRRVRIVWCDNTRGEYACLDADPDGGNLLLRELESDTDKPVFGKVETWMKVVDGWALRIDQL